ncbi:MAG TPA: hypothetical protein DEE98_04270 [Elusimicrobia bacterium]|nr:MAG: hypothetical protein A2278_07285 [Elusimicrobia bacterium RIFOXYA12_FULL_49_49]OGS10121.1 MAG: hypothetical protein A2204_03140 [Elusimicrobia bacterium RIFOXYA1_FULL_47_7]OGS16164.1 MAG: hypothetical protein A2251_00900 [Elusimicrobia bacterium RIFOXYA2_FULL_47_53]OGS26637.1 MAG: hypothetical protein A2339_04460 [Elusimicrobia bacterium RIFOXYB12_FULL_50_12]OGS31318.1 MAG: hypothetical protein A2323_09190 [Elusimicrobia bacterium RIFOXYB2_FULL_46_23]HBU69581.1 hypothetical protein [El
MRLRNNDFDKEYFSKIFKYKKLSEKEVHEIYKLKSENEAIEEIVIRNLQMAVNLVFKWQNSANKYGVDFNDLVQVSCLSMIKATRNYNPKLGGYYHYVASAISSYLECEIYKSTHYSRLHGKQRLKSGLDPNPTDSLEKIVAENEDGSPILLLDILSSPEDRKEFLRVEVNNMLAMLEKRKNSVHPLAKQIIELRYGLGGHTATPLPLSSVAKILNLSQEGVRKIEKKAIAYLRKL